MTAQHGRGSSGNVWGRHVGAADRSGCEPSLGKLRRDQTMGRSKGTVITWFLALVSGAATIAVPSVSWATWPGMVADCTEDANNTPFCLVTDTYNVGSVFEIVAGDSNVT